MAARTFNAVIFDAEGDVLCIKADQTAVGYCHPVRVARQIGQHGFGSGEGFFGVRCLAVVCLQTTRGDDPVDLVQGLQECVEYRALNEPSMFSKEMQLSGFV